MPANGHRIVGRIAAMGRSYKRLATRQRSLPRRASIAHTKSPSWHLHSWYAWRTLATLVT